MKQGIEKMRQEFHAIRTGRAHPAILDSVRVEYYGAMVPINQVASVSIPEPRLIELKPWDRSVLPELEKAILKSDLGMTPTNDGKVIRLPLPSLTEERRKELARGVKKIAETYRVAVRNDRRLGVEAVEALQTDKKISEDDLHHGKTELQRLTDQYVAQIDEILAHKEKEILEG